MKIENEQISQVEIPDTEEVESKTESTDNTSNINQDVLNDINEKLIKTIESQNKIIESLRKNQEESEKRVELLNEQLTKLDDRVQENIPTIIGSFDFDKAYKDLDKEQMDKMENDAREMYNAMKDIFKR